MSRATERANYGLDRARSVFVGNISYEVSEEQLRDVFSKVGTVVHLRMVYDRETSKPKGYGFCEYAEAKSAELAIRNLNGYELNGRALRVDSASGDQRHIGEPGEAAKELPEESMYGSEVEPSRAPEAISRSVASLPPEKMFALMKQMKDVVLTNSSEARNMLMQNPQLAYALLQAQVVMRIVDPQVAMTMLHRESPAGAPPPGPFHAPSTISPNPAFPPKTVAAGTSYSGPPHPGAYAPPPLPPTTAYGTSVPPGPMPPGYGAPPASASAPSMPGFGQALQEHSDQDRTSAELLVQVLNLSEAEIALFPPEERQKVLALRNQLRNI